MMAKARTGIWCDYCKGRYGKNRDGSWNDKAKKQAAVTIISETARAKGNVRSYCYDCIAEISAWTDNTNWPLTEQLAFAHSLENPTLEAMNV